MAEYDSLFELLVVVVALGCQLGSAVDFRTACCFYTLRSASSSPAAAAAADTCC